VQEEEREEREDREGVSAALDLTRPGMTRRNDALK